MSESSHEITISTSGMIISSFFEIFFPFILSFIWIRSFYGKLTCILMGIAGFLVSVTCETIFISLMSAIFGNKFIFYIILGISPGIFEETGRYFCLKYLLSKNKEQNNISVSYGIGHGGIESILIGISLIINFLNKDRLIKDGDITQNISFLFYIMSAWERFFSILFHISASVFVFKAVKEKNINFFIISIIIHDVTDLFALLYKNNILNIFLVELIIAIISTIFAYYAYNIYKNQGFEKEDKKEEKIYMLEEKKENLK